MTKKVTIDPGHHPLDHNKGQTGYYEYAGMWKLSNYLKQALERCNVKVNLTRTKNQNPTLTQRGNSARGSDLFISQHSNAFNNIARGVEVFYSVQRPNDRIWASKMSRVVSDLMKNPNRGAKIRESENNKGIDYYTVINSAIRAGVRHVLLIESGFHDELRDEAFLKVDNNLKKIAEVQCKVICELLGVEYIEEGDRSNMNNKINKSNVFLDNKFLGEGIIFEDRVYLGVRQLENIRYKINRWDANTKTVYLLSV